MSDRLVGVTPIAGRTKLRPRIRSLNARRAAGATDAFSRSTRVRVGTIAGSCGIPGPRKPANARIATATATGRPLRLDALISSGGFSSGGYLCPNSAIDTANRSTLSEGFARGKKL